MAKRITILEKREFPFRKSCENCKRRICPSALAVWSKKATDYGVENIVCQDWDGEERIEK